MSARDGLLISITLAVQGGGGLRQRPREDVKLHLGTVGYARLLMETLRQTQLSFGALNPTRSSPAKFVVHSIQHSIIHHLTTCLLSITCLRKHPHSASPTPNPNQCPPSLAPRPPTTSLRPTRLSLSSFLASLSLPPKWCICPSSTAKSPPRRMERHRQTLPPQPPPT